MKMFSDILKKIDIFFPTPKFLSFDLVSLDISPRCIRLMKLKKDKHGFTPHVYKEVRLKNKNELSTFGSKKDINTESYAEVIEVLKNLKKEFKLEYVVVSLPETNTYIYRTTLPAESASDLASAIRYKLEENVPLRTEDVNFDYLVIDTNKDGNEDLDVIVTVFPKEIISLYTKILKMSGLFPVSFQSESISLFRSMVKKGDREPYMLLRFLKDQVNVGLVEDGAVQYASIIQADSEKIVNDFDSKEAEHLNESLNKMLIFWFTSRKDLVQHKKIETALITGEYSTSEGLKDFLERKLKIDVEFANVWSNCFSLDEYIPEINKKDSLNYPVAIGLAIKGVTHA